MARKRAAKRPTSKKPAARKKRFFIPYPLLLFLLLCSGAFLSASTLGVSADDIIVTAKVSGPLVTSPAEITKPKNNQHFSKIPIKVAGTCPANAAYVEIFRNNLMSGSAICSGGTFQLNMDLFFGRNELVAHVFNITDDEGPVSDTVTVFYDKPKTPRPAVVEPTEPSSPTPSVSQLIIRSPFVYKGYYVGDEVKWPVGISGGAEPYAVNVDWGDGDNSVVSRSTTGDFTINHTYQKPGPDKGFYKIIIKASDNSGQSAYLEFFILVNTKSTVPAAGIIYSKTPPDIDGNSFWLWIAWPAYILVVLMTLSYLLGERQELITLRRQHRLRRS